MQKKRKNKGYQRQYDKNGRELCIPKGASGTLDQYVHFYDEWLQKETDAVKRDYAIIEKHPDLTGDELIQYCRFWLHRVQIDNQNIVPLETAIENLEKRYRRFKSSYAHGSNNCHGYQRRIVRKDNQKFVYNSNTDRYNVHKVRIPSLKRSKATWKRFYELFPMYKERFDELNGKNGVKLKKVW